LEHARIETGRFAGAGRVIQAEPPGRLGVETRHDGIGPSDHDLVLHAARLDIRQGDLSLLASGSVDHECRDIATRGVGRDR